jgi:hypothetical protein
VEFAAMSLADIRVEKYCLVYCGDRCNCQRGGAVTKDPDYDLIPPLQGATRGTQCGECGAKFDYDKAYGFVCGNLRCPVQLKTTC